VCVIVIIDVRYCCCNLGDDGGPEHSHGKDPEPLVIVDVRYCYR
jgi:hypothetical protein